ncbi:MAG: hypothetical protein ACR2PT_19960 [Endozoicomonas sp.]
MDLSPYDHCRSDHKLCKYGRAINILALGLTMLLISGFAQASPTATLDTRPAIHISQS